MFVPLSNQVLADVVDENISSSYTVGLGILLNSALSIDLLRMLSKTIPSEDEGYISELDGGRGLKEKKIETPATSSLQPEQK